MQRSKNLNAVSMDPHFLFDNSSNDLKKTPVIDVLIKTFPIIDDSIPYDEILSFREDKEVRTSIVALRAWMRKIANANLSQHEIKDEIECLLNDYRKFMELQKIKYSLGSFSSILKFSLGVAEDIAALRFKNIADEIFNVLNQDVMILEAEMNSPGRELSHMSKVHDRFF